MRGDFIGAGLTIVGIGVALVLTLPPAAWPKMPPWLVHLGIAAGGALIIAGTVTTIIGVRPALVAYLIPISLGTASAIFALSTVLAFYWLPNRSDDLIEGSIFVSCQMGFLPTNIPPEGKVYIVSLSAEELIKGGRRLSIGTISGPVGSAISWKPE